MELIRRWILTVVVIALTLGMHWYVARRVRGFAAWTLAALASLWMVIIVPLLQVGGAGLFGTVQISYMMAGSLGWVILATSAALWTRLRSAAEFNPERRRFLAVGAPVVAAAPLVAAGGGVFVARSGMRTREVTLKIEGLAKDLDGLRLAQLTDIHYGPFFGRAELERAVAMANECKPHLTVVTGDLITRRGDDLAGCLQVLRKLKAEGGIYGCHGNHEADSGLMGQATELGLKQGLRMLRGEAAALRFGAATLNLAGHDYQRMGQPPLAGGGALARAGALNVLLQHNPAVFPRASALGFDLMLAGHTHGGQINVEVFEENLNVARLFTPYVRGEYARDGKLLYVSSGLGTVGIPVRLGAPPEVTVIRLCAV
jgi:predicted MPP superfamily phosphohydrolase